MSARTSAPTGTAAARTMVRELIRPVGEPAGSELKTPGAPTAWATTPVRAATPDDLDLLEPDFDDVEGSEHGSWVDAAPFRAHVRQLIETCGITWRTVAMLAEVPSAAVARLLRGRRGRPVPRLHPLIAERLFHLTGDAVAEASLRPAYAGRTRALLQRLTERGWTPAQVSERTGLPGWEVDGIAAGERVYCSRLTEATIKAAAQALWSVPAPAAGRPLAPRTTTGRPTLAAVA